MAGGVKLAVIVLDCPGSRENVDWLNFTVAEFVVNVNGWITGLV